MSEFKNLLLARQLAEQRRDEAAAVASQVQREQNFALAQMDQLESYARETQGRWQTSAQLGAAPELLRHHYQFMGRLDQAIEMQRSAMQRLHERALVARQSVVDAEVYLGGIERVLKNRQAQALVVARRRDQKQMDEFAAMQTQRKLAQHHIEELS